MASSDEFNMEEFENELDRFMDMFKMAEAEQKKTESNFKIKVDKIRKKSYAITIFLKPDDVIVALNNQFYTYGEKKFIEELKDLNKILLITIICFLTACKMLCGITNIL